MRPLYIVDMQCTIFHSGIFEQGTSKLTPRYLFRCLTVNPAVKYCRCVDKDFLGHWIYTDLWVNNAFSFWSLKARIASVPLVPFRTNRALLSCAANRSNISFYSRDSTRPFRAQSPLIPWGPWRPCFPLGPGAPIGPKGPCGPVTTEAPFSPLYPGYPWGPGSPLGPGSPSWQILSLLMHAWLNFSFISWRTCCKDILGAFCVWGAFLSFLWRCPGSEKPCTLFDHLRSDIQTVTKLISLHGVAYFRPLDWIFKLSKTRNEW